MPALAFDIGTYSIKFITGKTGNNLELDRLAEVFNSTGVAVPTDDAGEERLRALLQTVMNDYGLPTDDVRLSLPETVASTKVISVPPLTDAELASAIGWQAERHIPIPPEELSLQYEVLFRPAKGEEAQMRVLLVGVRKQIIERLVRVFNDLGVEPTLIETQTLSIIRALRLTANDPTTLVAHFGAASLVIALLHQLELQFVVSEMSGSQVLSKTLEKAIGLDAAQAEQYKRSFGLDETQFQGKVRQTLLPVVSEFVAQLRKAMQFFSTDHPQEAVKRVILSGGASVMPGFAQYVAAELGIEVLVATPLANVKGEVPANINQPAMTACVGLLLRELG